MKVMVLDDDAAITRLTKAVLRMHGFEVTEYNDPLQAVTILETEAFNLILVDIMMPGMHGIQFIEEVRKSQLNATTPCVILTAKKLVEDERRKIFEMGGEIMTKPFIPQKLVEKVREML
ncbi:MAG: hypothetical protein CVV64_13300 [Candidatus Wallbacteria bacterium HGW-Wallbacteria-1]|jgi:two-component system phosphate regulon response regulator OmpR|uniref:Response regulatory domain-containing protein n=1 Tax=Candidatus Wallbacteria bacterium HGW-Wallbacteria-1 TaxID=2013854 RepID=A0A2N1PMT3_9BACT|nr:MAG: hypothetical protein CVV64_13300 [Candidatus Wallbacteria bacterium HGW-Wallbacteria-1]